MKKRVSTFTYVIRRGPEALPEILVVLRSPNDRYFPRMWGLPAGTLRKYEGCEQAIRRTALHRLGIEVEILGERAAGSTDRETHVIEMRLFEARIIAGSPRIQAADSEGHGYIDVRWERPDILQPTRERGSLCCRLAAEWLGTPAARGARENTESNPAETATRPDRCT